MRAFERLDLKNIQLDTLAHTLFDRMSTLHPHNFAIQPDENMLLKDPLEQIQKQVSMYKIARDQSLRQIWRSLDTGSYASAIQIREVVDTLSQTLSAATSSIEARRISRLTGHTSSKSSPNGFAKLGWKFPSRVVA